MPSLAELSPYNPTWRDKIASYLMGDGRASPERRAFVEGLVGSSGLGTKGMSLADLSPVGGVFQANEARNPQEMSLAAIGMLPGAGAVERALPKVERGIIAYHGSPHSFDRFDLSKIGTGEGAQAYGHGLYFADNEGVARSYRDANQTYKTFLNGEPIGPSHPQFSPVMSVGANGYDKALKQAEEFAAAGFIKPEELDAIRALKGAKIEQKPGGSMYQVRINADPEHFLDWDKPLSEQSPAVREALAKHDADTWSPSGNDYDPSELGQLAYSRLHSIIDANRPNLVPKYGEQAYFEDLGRLTSKELNASGIPGIKYLDQGSRGAGEGSRNYVVFDDKLIEIMKKYGLAGLGLGLPAFAAMNAQQQKNQTPGL